eukprot:scaffold2.g7118.t1
MAAVGRRPRPSPAWCLLMLAALHAAGLALFSRGLLIWRAHLPHRGAASPHVACAAPPVAPLPAPPFRKVVWLLIDALRYDMVVPDAGTACRPGAVCHQGRMEYLARLLAEQPAAARAFKVVAEPPAITAYLLPALACGTLPAWFDLSASFTLAPVADDSLLTQLKAAGRRLVFMGDDTWRDLFPGVWGAAQPFNSHDVEDIDVTDSGVWELLLPTLRQPGAWDLLLAHYLGVVEELLPLAESGGVHRDTLVLVGGDHGQTLAGDHGWGGPEEMDTVLAAIDLAALHDVRAGGGGAARPQAGAPAALAACRLNCTCGAVHAQCAPSLSLLDVAPSLAALLGVPIPFASVGAVSPELWGMAAAHASQDPEQSLAAVLRANADQVHGYLNTYQASTWGLSSFSNAVLAALNTQHARLPQPCRPSPPAEAAAASAAFLEAANQVARQQWSRFRPLQLVAGLALLAGSLALSLAAVARASSGSGAAGRQHQGRAAAFWRRRVPTALLSVPAAVHTCGVFSFFFLVNEGAMTTYLVALHALLLTALAARGSRGAARPLAGGALALACAGALAAVGPRDHSGRVWLGKLTVMHDEGWMGPATRWAGRAASGVRPLLRALLVMWQTRLGAAAALAPRDVALWQALAAHVAVCLLPTALLALLVWRGLRGRGMTLRLLLLASMACAALYHLSEHLQTPLGSKLTVGQAAQAAAQAAAPLLGSLGLEPLCELATATALWQAPAAALGALVGGADVSATLAGVALLLSAAAGLLWLRQRLGPAASTSDSVAVAGILLPAILVASPPHVPLVLLLAAAEGAALAALLVQAGGPAAVHAGLVCAAVQMQLFFATGHAFEFAGVQGPAALVGLEGSAAAAWAALDAYGAAALAALAMPCALAACSSASHEERSRALLVLQLARTLTVAAAATGAAVQRLHMFAWSLFAPRFALEAGLLLASDAASLALAALVP